MNKSVIYFQKISMPLSVKEKDVEQFYKDENACIDFLIREGILYSRNECEVCKRGKMKRYPSAPKIWHCNYHGCRFKISVFLHSFFAKSKIPCHDLLRIGYKWLSGQRYTDILEQTKHSTVTVSTEVRFFGNLFLVVFLKRILSLVDPELLWK
jgi:hypothetical protein